MSRTDVHVWSFELDVDTASAAAVLSEEELFRAHRFHFSVHRDRFIACRSIVRRILGEWLDVPPADVTFRYGAHGKPLLRDAAMPHFNVTHSENRAMLAICEQHPVGIDLERVRPMDDLPQLAALVFNDRERRQMDALCGSDRTHAFFRGWSRKEAYFKGTGIGLSAQLHAVTVDLARDAARIVDVCGGDPGRWSMYDVPTPPGFVGAVAVGDAGTGLILRGGVACAN